MAKNDNAAAADVSPSSTPPTIQSVKLKGHRGAVLCLDHSSSLSGATSSSTIVSAGCLLSGSEDGTARLWDLRDKLRASLCIQTSETDAAAASSDVLSVAFGPPWKGTTTTTNDDGRGPPTSSPWSRDYTVYLSTASDVYAYDLRRATCPILKQPHVDLALRSEDEVNQVILSHRSASAAASSSSSRRNNRQQQQQRQKHHNQQLTYLAAADDAGCVRITDRLEQLSSSSQEQRQGQGPRVVLEHDTNAMVTCAAFRPRCKGVELVTGGTDCFLRLWDVAKSAKQQQGQTTRTITTSNTSCCCGGLEMTRTDTSVNEVCNPPMVHSVAWSPSGRLLVAGLGDGSLAVASADQRRLVLNCRVQEAHSGTVASVVFPEWQQRQSSTSSSSSSLHVAAHDRLLATAGNDALLVLWDLGSMLCGQGAMDPRDTLQLNDTETSTGGAAALSASTTADITNSNADVFQQPRALVALQLAGKPNWVVSSRGRDPVFPSSLFVADTTHDIAAYKIPCQ